MAPTQTLNPPALGKLLYSPKEAAALLSCSRATLYRMIGDGKLETVKLGSLRRIKAESIVRAATGGNA